MVHGNRRRAYFFGMDDPSGRNLVRLLVAKNPVIREFRDQSAAGGYFDDGRRRHGLVSAVSASNKTLV